METARKDSAVHVSLSSDLLVKQPGPRQSPTLVNSQTVEARGLRFLIGCPVTLISEELRRRAITPKRAARRTGRYIGRGLNRCQSRGEQNQRPPQGAESTPESYLHTLPYVDGA
jgi:hypothetical protein